MSEPILSILEEGRAQIRVHLIGVAGSGMSGIAGLLIDLGHSVSGSDKVRTKEVDRLEKKGLVFSSPHSAEAVKGADMVVYSSAVKAGNLAYDGALAEDIPLVRRAEALAAILRCKKGIVVSGTHGKTTTSALLSHVLRLGGLAPSHYVGAEIPILGSNAHWDPHGEHFVAEGDESDGTLALFHPHSAIILNIEAEHLDFYDGIEAIKEVFSTMVRHTDDTVYYCGECATATEVGQKAKRSLSYGRGAGYDFSAEVIDVMGEAAGCRFKVSRRGEELGEATLGIPGAHNVLNALAAIAVASELGVPFDRIGEALATFRGARRRFEVKHLSEDYAVVDDYGHHPTEVEATVQTALSLGRKRLLCVFQPHRYSRTQLLKKEFGVSFKGVDGLIVSAIYPASERPLPGVTGQTIVDEVIAATGQSAVSVPSLSDARLKLGNQLKPGDLVLTLGAGSVHEVGSALAKDLEVLKQIRAALGDDPGLAKLYEPMSLHTTIRVGGPAQFWIEPHTVAGFASVVRFLRARAIPIQVVGRGSNLLVRDGGIPGAVIHPVKGELGEVSAEGVRVTAGVGARLKKLASVARQAGIGGFEWMEGIPGNVGGGIRMNAGAMGVETFDQVVDVTYIDGDGEVRTKLVGEIDAHYRNVPEFSEHYVVRVTFEGALAPLEEIDQKLEESRMKRKTSQPIAASAGCTFKNPEQIPAGKLIDELGLKGRSVGNAEVSEIHGNFIVNKGNAPAADVLSLIAEVSDIAYRERGIRLETEVQIIGEDVISF